MAKRINLLEGSLWDKILAFALPLATTSIIQQLFNLSSLQESIHSCPYS